MLRGLTVLKKAERGSLGRMIQPPTSTNFCIAIPPHPAGAEKKKNTSLD
jgi:hypothetical protein